MKAQRLLCEGRLTPDPAPASVFHVRGDHGNYVVVVGAHVAMCSCPHTGRCSHIDAAAEWVNADGPARELMHACLEQRRARDRARVEPIFAAVGA